ncbi:MAG TPA: ASKHA domain-containing protein [Candidatus Eremiobacteraeota bacterium]|nr:MAG: hypothetical protein BWY64_03175 [bacterium ADurb.Bin363]HPZ07113.1 ASKHA domain-containing protein [Candidatus Eremiobacteraeota bacterium]
MIKKDISLLLKKLSINFSEIDKLFIAGGTGNSLNIDNAIEIGLFPSLNKEKISLVGNSSLSGAIKYSYILDKN